VKRVAALACLWLLPSVAHAQMTGAAAVDAGNDVDALMAQLDRDYAQALASDCALACKALESMRRSADRLCQLEPGDRCARAKQKVDSASARVKATCPTCAEQLGEKAPAGGAGGAAGATPPPREAPAPPTETLYAEAVQASPRRGCGCTTAASPADAFEAMAFGGLVLAVLRRRKRR
jgi:MYXO-CTERM domain-containing protein